jgi:hypothetical protein
MKEETIIKSDNFNVNNIKFEHINKRYIKMYYINTYLKITTPILNLPFGIQTFNNTNNCQTLYNLKLSIDNQNIQFYNFIKSIEEYINEYIKNNVCQTISLASKIYKNNDYYPLLKLDICKDDIKYIKYYISESDIITDDNLKNICFDEIMPYLKSNTKIKCDINFNGIWLSDFKFGISCKLRKIIIFRNKCQT